MPLHSNLNIQLQLKRSENEFKLNYGVHPVPVPEVFFPFIFGIGIFKPSTLKSDKPPRSYEVKRHIANFDLKQQQQASIKERTTINPMIIANDNQIKMMLKYTTIDLKMLIV